MTAARRKGLSRSARLGVWAVVLAVILASWLFEGHTNGFDLAHSVGHLVAFVLVLWVGDKEHTGELVDKVLDRAFGGKKQ